MKNKITKKSTIRDVLQILGTDLLRKQFNSNIHVAATMGEIKSEDKVIITDLRFPNEYEAVKKRGGITIRVNRPSVILDGIGYNSGDHPSEVALDHVTDWDYVIDNSGTIEELVEKVRTILVNEKII